MHPESTDRHRLSATRKILLVCIAILLVIAAWFAYTGNQTADAPASSTTESRPNSTQNVPPSSDGSVTQDEDENDSSVPSSSGTGANNYMSEEQGTTGVQ